ncbi:tetratricopeptide repeat protein [Bacteroidetes/Chlorobi group bacterium ChocPot_Mid]|jgi:tetratricopeptide (TPR) repeat protein|nr:MAG: tetratricopeptide repeat protein [Bacteroidetes/Chlorobi group bacterium ChocPot_Mid]
MANLEEKKGKEDKISKSKDKGGVEPQENLIVRAQQFIYENSKVISYSLLGLIVLVTLGFFLKGYLDDKSAEDREKAMVALTRILPYYDAPDYKKALFGDSSAQVRGERVIGLMEIVEKYEGTDQGKLAALYAGSSYLALSKAEEAIEYFEIATGSDSKVVLTGAYAGLGASYELLKKFDKSADYYSQAAELAVSDGTKTRYNYYAARAYEQKGEKETAAKIYKEIIAKDKLSEFSNYAKVGLVRLGIKID